MNFLDHTLPAIAQNYLSELACTSARLAAQNQQFENRQTQVTELAHQVAALSKQLADQHTGHQQSQTHITELRHQLGKLENRLKAAEQTLQSVEKLHEAEASRNSGKIEKHTEKKQPLGKIIPINPRLAKYGYVHFVIHKSLDPEARVRSGCRRRSPGCVAYPARWF